MRYYPGRLFKEKSLARGKRFKPSNYRNTTDCAVSDKSMDTRENPQAAQETYQKLSVHTTGCKRPIGCFWPNNRSRLALMNHAPRSLIATVAAKDLHNPSYFGRFELVI